MAGEWESLDIGDGSKSCADLELCTLLAMKYKGDWERVNADFRDSKLCRAEKWKRDDYRTDTLTKAVENAEARITASMTAEEIYAEGKKVGFDVERLPPPVQTPSRGMEEFQKQMRNENTIEILPPEAESTEALDYVSHRTASVDANLSETICEPPAFVSETNISETLAKTIILATDTAINQDGDAVRASLTGILASNVTLEKLSWLWDQRIPAGKITWLAGKPECGKSLVLLDLIARTTTGRDWPDGAKNTLGAKTVLLAVSEDDLGDTVIPASWQREPTLTG